MNDGIEHAALAADSPVLLTIQHVARLLSTSRTTLYLGIQAGSIRIIKIGRSSRIARDELLRLAREGIKLR